MKYSCIIIDDEPIAIEVIGKHLERVEEIKLLDGFTDPLKAIRRINTSKPDLIFLDIEMPVLTGFDLLKTLTYKPSVILTTAHRDYAVEAFNFHVLDYLLKPVSFKRLMVALEQFFLKKSNKSLPNANAVSSGMMIVKADKKFHKVFFRDILYIESMDDFIRLHFHQSKLDIYDRLVHMEKKLPASIFLRIHRSIIVNTLIIKSFSTSEVYLDKVRLPIGKNYRENVFQFLSESKNEAPNNF